MRLEYDLLSPLLLTFPREKWTIRSIYWTALILILALIHDLLGSLAVTTSSLTKKRLLSSYLEWFSGRCFFPNFPKRIRKISGKKPWQFSCDLVTFFGVVSSRDPLQRLERWPPRPVGWKPQNPHRLSHLFGQLKGVPQHDFPSGT